MAEHAPEPGIRSESGHLQRPVRLASDGLPGAPHDFFTVHCGDARRLELYLGQYSSEDAPLLTTTITSPPYANLKDYGHPAQIGRGQAYDEYLIDLRRVFRGIAKHTRVDGSLWVIADTLRPKDGENLRRLRPLPFDLVAEAEKAGWILREIIIWQKGKTLPWSGRGRLRNSFEYVLFFVKSSRYKYHVDRIREPVNLEEWWVRYPERYNPEGKVPTNVWEIPIPVQGSWANTAIQHACPLPSDLAERLILLSTDEQDVVFDPFAGSGIVVAEAARLLRRGMGIELVSRYVDAYERTVRPEILSRRGIDVLAERLEQSRRLRETIIKLRLVKFPRALIRQVERLDGDLPRPVLSLVLPARLSPSKRARYVAAAQVVIFLDGKDADQARYCEAAVAAARRRPTSKFGVDADFEVCQLSELGRFTRGRKLYAYVNGRTHQAAGAATARSLRKLAMTAGTAQYPPIASTIHVWEQPRRLRADEELSN